VTTGYLLETNLLETNGLGVWGGGISGLAAAWDVESAAAAAPVLL